MIQIEPLGQRHHIACAVHAAQHQYSAIGQQAGAMAAAGLQQRRSQFLALSGLRIEQCDASHGFPVHALPAQQQPAPVRQLGDTLARPHQRRRRGQFLQTGKHCNGCGVLGPGWRGQQHRQEQGGQPAQAATRRFTFRHGSIPSYSDGTISHEFETAGITSTGYRPAR
ncbi:hypothetical protein [Massilia sp. YIM B04103]|uniref:hypothetical protein n=1 Tax=Massilia sp. YIM B04103 TaxID=2963106 RepID=UPI00210867C9|nr:hypothetical protein [Massilia sp. YIM B04103]